MVFKLQQEKLVDVREHFPTIKKVKHWNELHREAGISVIGCFQEQVRQTSVKIGLGTVDPAFGQGGDLNDPLRPLLTLFAVMVGRQLMVKYQI